MKLIIPCTDCDAETERLKNQGFSVSDCAPVASRTGMCELNFDVISPSPSKTLKSATKVAAPPQQALTATSTVDFIGRGNPLTQDGLDRAASDLDVSLSALWAIMTVETKGCGFLPDRRPLILFERHIFHKRTGGQFDSVAPDLSRSVQGGYGKGGAGQYDRLARAVALDRKAALESTSWGLGQVMGFNAKSAGYPDVETMVAAMSQTEDAQFLGMINFIANNNLSSYLKKDDWSGFAKHYNGEGFQKNRYDTKLQAAFARYSVGPIPNLDVRAAQLFLSYRGYSPGTVDGWYGTVTQNAVIKFQKEIGLPASGLLDNETLTALSCIS